MIPYEKALEIVHNHTKTGGSELVDLLSAGGRVLREDVKADMDNPPFTNSAMDGYAVRAGDTKGASRDKPVALKITGEAPAGSGTGLAIGPGETAAIMTGGPLPEGADAIVIVEDTEKSGDASVKIFKEAGKTNHVRYAGEDIRKGETVIPSGTIITPGAAALLATFGKSRVPVSKKPAVGILSTGNELVEPDAVPGPGQIRNSNAYFLYNSILSNGGLPDYYGIAADNREDTEMKIRKSLEKSDILITTGGVSVGEYDYVKEILQKIGISLHFTRVAVKPGRPLTFGTTGDKLFFGLPGNPVSTMVTFNLFVVPCIARFCGMEHTARLAVPCELEEDVRLSPGRRNFIRFIIRKQGNKMLARSTGRQDSGRLRSIVYADGLASFPPEMTMVQKGALVDVQLL